MLHLTPGLKFTSSQDPSVMELLLFDDEKLRESFGRALTTAGHATYVDSSTRPRKRVRRSGGELAEDSAPSDEDWAIRRLYSLLGVDAEADTQGLENAAV